MDVRHLYDSLHREPQEFPLFERVWDILTLAPSSKHSDEEALVSLAADAFDYLQATGRWTTSSTTGRTELFWDGLTLRVNENDDGDFAFHRSFAIH